MDRLDVYKQGVHAASLERDRDQTRFVYLPSYLSAGGQAVATTLPLRVEPFVFPPGSVPPYFAGLLPEGRRLTALTRQMKISLDDEFSLLAAVGTHAIGDVVVSGQEADEVEPGVDLPPDLSAVSFAELAGGAPEFAAVAGAQEKVTDRMISLPAKFSGQQYILKLTPPEFPRLVENEHYFLQLAKRCGITHAQAELVHDRDGAAGLLVTRFDRGASGEAFALEDGCQVLGRWPADKYLLTSEEVFAALAGRCSADLVAMRDLFTQLAFAVITGNGDAHAKNFSILDRAGEWRIAPAYDLPSTVFYDDPTLALSIAGTKRPPARRNLLEFALKVGLPEAAATSVLDDLLAGTEPMLGELEAGALELDETRLLRAVKELRYRRRQLMP